MRGAVPTRKLQAVEAVTCGMRSSCAWNYALVGRDALYIKVPLCGYPGGVVIRYRAGYGDTSADVQVISKLS